MRQNTASRGTSTKSRRSPTTTEIARRREEIQANWSSEERRTRRSPQRRVNNNAAQMQAQIRFLEFLISYEDTARQSDSVRPARRR